MGKKHEKNFFIQVSKRFMNKFNAQVGTSDSSVSSKVRFFSVWWCGPTFLASMMNHPNEIESPMQRTSVSFLPVYPTKLPLRTLSLKASQVKVSHEVPNRALPYPETLVKSLWQQLGLDCIKDRMHIRHYILAIHIDHLLKIKLTQACDEKWRKEISNPAMSRNLLMWYKSHKSWSLSFHGYCLSRNLTATYSIHVQEGLPLWVPARQHGEQLDPLSRWFFPRPVNAKHLRCQVLTQYWR